VIGLLVRLDARRPASWVAAVAAVAASSSILVRCAPAWAAAACGCLLAVAAVGFPARLAAVPELAVPRAMARIAWPLLGLGAGAAVAGRWATADATAAVAAAVLGVVITVGGLLAMTARWCRRLAAGGGDDAVAGGVIDALAMASVLVAMAVCYFLAPQLAGWYAAVAGGWFVALVVPRATLDAADDTARRTLVASAVGLPRLPGTPAHAVRTLATGAAILGWPAIVGSVLWSGPAATPAGPVAALVLLATLAGMAAAIVRLWRTPGDTPLAVVAGTLATAFALFAQAL